MTSKDQKRRTEERLEDLLLHGLESPFTEWTKDDVDRVKSAVRERLTAKQSADKATIA